MRPSDLFVGKAVRVRGSHEEAGMALLRPGYVVFVPKGKDAWSSPARYEGAMMPQAFHDLAAYVGYLRSLPEAEFDGTIDAAVKQHGWSRVPLGEAKVDKKRGLFRRSKVTVAIRADEATIRFDGPLPESSVADVESLLAR